MMLHLCKFVSVNMCVCLGTIQQICAFASSGSLKCVAVSEITTSSVQRLKMVFA